MKQCPQCFNYEIGEKDNYCKICGMNLKGEAAAETTAQKNADKDRKYKKVTMSLSVPTRLVAFARNEEECQSLIEKEDWLLMFSPSLGNSLVLQLRYGSSTRNIPLHPWDIRAAYLRASLKLNEQSDLFWDYENHDLTDLGFPSLGQGIA